MWSFNLPLYGDIMSKGTAVAPWKVDRQSMLSGLEGFSHQFLYVSSSCLTLCMCYVNKCALR